MNHNGLESYGDSSSYLIDPQRFSEFKLDDLIKYMIVYGIDLKFLDKNNIIDELKKIVTQIINHKVDVVHKYLKIEDDIFKKGIRSNDVVYRVQDKPINGDTIKNATSWSLAPIEWFGGRSESWLYITRIPKHIKVIYLENDSTSKHLATFKDFTSSSMCSPRYQVQCTKHKKIKNVSRDYDKKSNDAKIYRTIHCVWIKIIEIVKVDYPKIESVLKSKCVEIFVQPNRIADHGHKRLY